MSLNTETHTFNDELFPTLTKSHVDYCKYSNWYLKFENKEYNSFIVKSHIFQDIPEKFIQFLLEDGIKLKSNAAMNHNNNGDDEFSDWSSNSDSSDDEEEESNNKFVNPNEDFPEIDTFITKCFSKNDKLTPRFNWSAPKDAVWILPYNNTMLTYTNEDIYLLLKSSNYIMHDLLYAYENVKDENEEKEEKTYSHDLILREWIDNINPSLEFRCFIKDGEIIGISQRDIRTEYCYLIDIKEKLQEKIEDFVETVFIPAFFESDSLYKNETKGQNAVIDLYVDLEKDFLKIIDVNAFCRSTEPLLFSWNELITRNSDDEYEFRLGQNNTKLGGRDHSENQVPLEIFDASLDPEKLRELTYEWCRLLKKQIKEVDT
ncbi:D123-domain-containing protein, partial [Hanseniaspora valbyensis NRRL Y-1626]